MDATAPKLAVRRIARRDLGEITRIHRQQFPASRSSQIGKPFVRKMYQWFSHYQSHLSLVATLDGKPVGFATGAIGGYGRRISRYALPEILLGLVSHPRLLFNRQTFNAWTSYIQAFRPGFARSQVKANAVHAAPSDGAKQPLKASLASIAVDGAAQGKGVGKALVRAFEEAAKNRGAGVLGLSVEADNVAARRLYESCGWVFQADPQDADSAYYSKQIVS